MSVKIVDYKLRVNSEGKSFLALILQGGIEIVKSATGNMYATAKKVSLATTFDESTCKLLIGTDMPGQIVREECDPYQYRVEDTGEVIILSHRYVFVEAEPVAAQDFTKVYRHLENGVKENV